LINSEIQEIPMKICEAVSKYVKGRDENTRLLAVALLSGGHVLLEGYPGSGKTTLGRCFAQAIGGEFKRIQLVADMLPGDITGFNVLQSNGESKFVPGPIFANVVLADELNRTTTRTQGAFLEAMQEGRTTVEGNTYYLPQPFLIIATQLPVGTEGTYPLPEGELDRFLFRLWSGFLPKDIELGLLEMADSLENPIIDPVTSPEIILQLRNSVRNVNVSEPVKSYMVDLLLGIRQDEDVLGGPSSRAGLALFRSSRALAFLDNRDFVLPDDVRSLVTPIFEHRIRLTGDAELDETTPKQVIERVLNTTPIPKGDA
jgi:MoxR-like ATPase